MWWRSGYISCVVKFLPGFQIRGKPMTQGDMVPPCTTLPQLATARYLVPDPIWKIQGGPEKVAFWMFCIWYGGGFRGGSFSIPTLYCRLNWRQWFRRKQILEFSVYSLEKFHRGNLCPHREMQQSSLCVQMFYFNMKRHKLIHGIIYTWYEHNKGTTDTEAIVSDLKSQLTPRRSPVFTNVTRHCPWKDEPAKVRLHYLLLPLLPPPGVT